MQTRCLKFSIAICLAVAILGPGCRQKSSREMAEQKALARHEREEQQRQAFVKLMRQGGMARMSKGAQFLVGLARNGRLPGLSANEHGQLRLDKPPEMSAKGPYFFSEELHVIAEGSPPRHYRYVVVQTYSNSDFQVQRAWRADPSGKVIETYPVAPPAKADAGRIFLGPVNPGAESELAHWYSGTLGGGTVSVGTGDPATGFNHFTIGITNAASGQTNHADFRSEPFPLGSAKKIRSIVFSFAYKLPEKVKRGDNIEVYFRFFDSGTNFLGQKMIPVGSSTSDSEMSRYKTMTTRILVPHNAVTADIWVVANIFGPWTSGTAQFDDFSATVAPGGLWARIFVGTGAVIFAALTAWLIGAFYARDRRRRQMAIPVADVPQ
jgi:hypothetical protein